MGSVAKQGFYRQFHLDLPESLLDFRSFYARLEAEGLSLSSFPFSIRLSRLFDLISGSAASIDEEYYFDDPPEWITLVDSVDSDGLHWGFFVESYPPASLPVALCRRSTPISEVGNDLFEALHHHLAGLGRSLRLDRQGDPENASFYEAALARVGSVEGRLRPHLGATPPWGRQPKIQRVTATVSRWIRSCTAPWLRRIPCSSPASSQPPKTSRDGRVTLGKPRRRDSR